MKAIGDRMKENYENRTRIYLPRRSNVILRVDGKAFHTYTKNLVRPFDFAFISDMDNTARYLCRNIMGAKLAFVQSDEISVLITDYDTINTQAWFDYNVQKMASVAASMSTGEFNRLRFMRVFDEENNDTLMVHIKNEKVAEFDARVFCIPEFDEVCNYFLWRQLDATRNSIQSSARAHYSHKELIGKNTNQMQEMLFQKGVNWNDFPPHLKRGRIVCKKQEQEDMSSWICAAAPLFGSGDNWTENFKKLII